MAQVDELFQSLEANPDLTEAQKSRMLRLKSLAQEAHEKGLIDLAPMQPENPRNEKFEQGQPVQQIGAGLGETLVEIGAGMKGAAEGARAGASTGFRLAGPRGALIGGVVGGIGGAGIGQSGARGGLLKLEEWTGQRPPLSTPDYYESTAKAFGEGVVGEGAGRLLSKAVPTGVNMVRRLLGGAHETGLQEFDAAAQMGVHQTPAKITGSRPGMMIERRLRESLPGSAKFYNRDVLNEQNFKTAIDTDAQQLWGAYKGEHAEGILLQKALKQEAIPEFDLSVNKLYGQLRDATQGQPLIETGPVYEKLQGLKASLEKKGSSFQPIVSTIDEVLDKLSNQGLTTGMTVKRSGTKAIPEQTIASSIVDPNARPIMTTIPEQPAKLHKLEVDLKSEAPRYAKPIDFMAAHEARQAIGRELSNRQLPMNDTDQRALKTAYKMLSDSMGEGAIRYTKETGQDVGRLWLLADRASAKGKTLFNESIVRNAIDSDPNKLVELAFKKNGETPTQNIMQALSMTKDGEGRYQQAAIKWLMKEATNPETNRISGKKFSQLANARGEEVLQETFKGNYQTVKKWIDIASKMDEPSRHKSGGMLLAENSLLFTTPNVVAGALLTGHPGVAGLAAMPAAIYVLTANRLAQVLTNPKQSRTLLEIAKTSPKSDRYIRLVSQLASMEQGELGSQFLQEPSATPVPFGTLSRLQTLQEQP